MTTFNRSDVIKYNPGQNVAAVLERGMEAYQEVKWKDRNTVRPTKEGEDPDVLLIKVEDFTVGGAPFGIVFPLCPAKFIRTMKEFGVKVCPEVYEPSFFERWFQQSN